MLTRSLFSFQSKRMIISGQNVSSSHFNKKNKIISSSSNQHSKTILNDKLRNNFMFGSQFNSFQTTKITKMNNSIFKNQIKQPSQWNKNFINNFSNSKLIGKNNFSSSTLFSIRSFYNSNQTTNSDNSTIYAVASGSIGSGSAVAVVRISGSKSKFILEKLLTEKQTFPKARNASLRKLMNPKTQEILDEALVIWFPSPASFTGEDVVELHLHGGVAVVSDVLESIGSLGGTSTDSVRMAEPGEFTKRAFLNEKLDLTEVEGLADLIHAQTQAQRRQAMRLYQGDLAEQFQIWKNILMQCMAHLEAVIDFGDDERLDEDIWRKVVERTEKEMLPTMRLMINDARKGELLRDGAHLVISGPPNAGKSSLMNLLAQRNASIVSPIPGTTRDVLEVTLNFGGFPLVLVDTAGIRNFETDDVIEMEGIRRAKERLSQSDLRMCVLDSSSSGIGNDLLPDSLLKTLIPNEETILVLNKLDLISENNNKDAIKSRLDKVLKFQPKDIVSLSCKSKVGFENLLQLLERRLKDLFHFSSLGAVNATMSRERQRIHLQRCIESLQEFIDLSRKKDSDVVMAAEQLRNAVKSLSMITGEISVDNLLDIVFNDFCIGK